MKSWRACKAFAGLFLVLACLMLAMTAVRADDCNNFKRRYLTCKGCPLTKLACYQHSMATCKGAKSRESIQGYFDREGGKDYQSDETYDPRELVPCCWDCDCVWDPIEDCLPIEESSVIVIQNVVYYEKKCGSK